ncbi:SGNH/GDSL hydrolase family protein [Yinghuangia seranimata]|uniref:SGNH/GDSL hydrolase family protein n=1 Tax=Yinghuangia seranimata TaxID=408067 RepID=UPI00248B95EC|nr:SGNH/GDSL hydrolase family protein [Yinghuangia seranimata]MDI2126757.1 SGNH/GDSL hydrolase family protein [Yinghuangia seranimata]
MRTRPRTLLVALFSAALLLVGGATSAGAAAGGQGPTYYVSLGDSLARGYMPGQGDTDQGYTDLLYNALKAKDPGLQHVKLGCSGATTSTLLNGGGRCAYPEGTQLAAAEKFLREHRGKVRFVTLDIGANDVARCAAPSGIDMRCASDSLHTVGTNLTAILKRLRAAGGAGPQYAGMTYYDPFLAAWLTGANGQQLAYLSEFVQELLNGVISTDLRTRGFAVADVAGAFSTRAFTPTVPLPGVGQVPLNVARICQWTFMCTRQDIHANPVGYQVLADTFAGVLTP